MEIKVLSYHTAHIITVLKNEDGETLLRIEVPTARGYPMAEVTLSDADRLKLIKVLEEVGV